MEVGQPSFEEIGKPSFDNEKPSFDNEKQSFDKKKHITEARTGAPRAGVVAKPSPLGDERGSVREIGLCVWMCPTPHFLELSPTVC